MASCEKLPKCPFYQGKMDINSGLGAMYRQKYCEGDKTQCARYRVATQCGPEHVPTTLYPNMNDTADTIIKDNKK